MPKGTDCEQLSRPESSVCYVLNIYSQALFTPSSPVIRDTWKRVILPDKNHVKLMAVRVACSVNGVVKHLLSSADSAKLPEPMHAFPNICHCLLVRSLRPPFPQYTDFFFLMTCQRTCAPRSCPAPPRLAPPHPPLPVIPLAGLHYPAAPHPCSHDNRIPSISSALKRVYGGCGHLELTADYS